MNWEAVGAIGEAVGALGVVVSMIYLATQIRQNTMSVRGQSVAAMTQNLLTEVLAVAGHDLHELFAKVSSDPNRLTEGDYVQLDAWLTASFSARQNEYAQYRLGTLDEALWKSTHRAIVENLGNDVFRRWWNVLGRPRFAEDFVAFVDTLEWRERQAPSWGDLVPAGGWGMLP